MKYMLALLLLANAAFADVAATVANGIPLRIEVTVETGTPPFGYQWRKNGVAIPGATAATLAIAKVATTDSGSYDVVVSNSSGQTVSDKAVLTVNPPTPPPVIPPGGAKTRMVY